MKLIDCSTLKHPNTFAVVDDEDFHLLNKLSWAANYSGGNLYAKTRIDQQPVSMHRMVMKAKQSDIIDHKDSNGLNNSKNNLRITDFKGNARNRRKARGVYSSKYKGVNWKSERNRWRAQIYLGDKLFFLGHFKKETEAARAYNVAAERMFGEYAKLNNIE